MTTDHGEPFDFFQFIYLQQTKSNLMFNSNPIRIAFGLLLSAILCLSATAQVNVSDPISVTDSDDSFGKRSPKIAINANGEPMVFWMRTGNEAFYLSTKTTSGFSDPTQISFGGLNPNLWGGSLGPNMASNGDDVYVTFEVYGDAIYVTHSPDAGQTWESPVAAFIPPQGRVATIPIIAVDSDGNPYVAYVNTNTSEGDAYYGMVRSADFGQNYFAEVDVSAESVGAEVCECCNGHIEVADNGDVFVAFRNNDNNLRDIWLARSTDGGETFSSAFDVDETDWTAFICPSNGPNFEIIDNEVVTVFWSGAGASGSGVYYSLFNNQSGVAAPTIDLNLSDISSSNQTRPRIAGVTDTLAIVWQESYNGSVDIAMSVSTSGISGLNTEAFRLGELPSTQQFPSMLYSNGSFHVVYEDSESNTVMYQEVGFNTLGLNENTMIEFSMWPNPAKDEIEIRHFENDPLDVQIIDIQGRVVYQGEIGQSSNVIDLQLLTPGVYQVILSNEKTYSSQKLIVV
jgi:hypothetical protein